MSDKPVSPTDQPDRAAVREFRVTELRVHGVGGATPEEVLDVPHTRLVAGGADAGFFRPTGWITVDGPPRNLEAYSWGGITSRSRTRALWLFLLPFALLNVAGWMDNEDDVTVRPSARRRWIGVAAIRLEALVTTAIFTMLISILTIEIAGYRCVGSDRCSDAWYLVPWWWARDPVDRIAIGIAAAAVIMLAISLIARAGLLGLDNEPSADEAIDPDPARLLSLDSAQLWRRPDIARSLGLIHISVTLALVSEFGAEAASRAADPGAWLAPLQIAGAVTIGAGVALLLAVGRAPRWAHWLIAVVSGALVIASSVLVWQLPAPTGPILTDEIVADTAGLVFAVFLVLLAARWLRYLWRYLAHDSIPRIRRLITGPPSRGEPATDVAAPIGLPASRFVVTLRRWAANLWDDDSPPLLSLRAAVPVLGAGIAVAIGAGILLRFQEILGTNYPTELLNRVAVFGLGWVALVALTAWWMLFSHPGRSPARIVAEDLGGALQPDARADEAWLRKISSAESAAHIGDQAATIITVPAVLMLFATLALLSDSANAFIDAAARPAAWVLSLLPIGLMLAMNSLYRSRNFRRALGIIWDIATLWPRWFHPWAPPSYGERAVPHLCRRIQELTKGDGAVILSAHSQGTVVAAAALAQLPAAARSRVAVVTHGSPLTRLYANYFSELFSVELFRDLAGQLAPGSSVAWRNLYRYTDYIGGPVFTTSPNGEVATDRPVPFEDVRLRDPYDPEPLMTGDPRPRPLNHSNYYQDPAYTATIAEYVARLGG